MWSAVGGAKDDVESNLSCISLNYRRHDDKTGKLPTLNNCSIANIIGSVGRMYFLGVGKLLVLIVQDHNGW